MVLMVSVYPRGLFCALVRLQVGGILGGFGGKGGVFCEGIELVMLACLYGMSDASFKFGGRWICGRIFINGRIVLVLCTGFEEEKESVIMYLEFQPILHH